MEQRSHPSPPYPTTVSHCIPLHPIASNRIPPHPIPPAQVLELGGSDPYLILEDADVEKAAAACATGRLLNAGQARCGYELGGGGGGEVWDGDADRVVYWGRVCVLNGGEGVVRHPAYTRPLSPVPPPCPSFTTSTPCNPPLPPTPPRPASLPTPVMYRCQANDCL